MNEQHEKRHPVMFPDFDEIPLVPYEAVGGAAPARGAGGGDTPLMGASAAYFTDMDAYTEYWDVYDLVPDSRYMDMFRVVGPTVVPAWNAFCRAEGTGSEPNARAELLSRAQVPAAAQALRGLDELLSGLVVSHFASEDGSIDVDAYLTVVEGFACDRLPPDEDRLRRVTELDPDDRRIGTALRHRMDGAGMWFTWAAVVDSVSMLDAAVSTPERERIRTVQLAACACGSAMDYVFRSAPGDPRGKTRPEYQNNPETLALLRTSGREWATDHIAARTQVRDLFRVATSS